MKIGIINYEAGNLQSVYNSIFNLGYDPIVIDNKEELRNIDKLIIPGVGSANLAIKTLKQRGLKEEIINFYEKEKYILGICLGFQIFAKKLFENGLSNGLKIIDGDVIQISKDQSSNIGLYDVDLKNNNFIQIDKKYSSFYFCHSYYVKLNSETENQYCLGEIKLNNNIIPSFYRKKNFFGTQFHPEKSQFNGLKIIQTFLDY